MMPTPVAGAQKGRAPLEAGDVECVLPLCNVEAEYGGW
jgi:hypothetical protein